MTIKELKKKLDQFPDDSPVCLCRLFGHNVTYDIDEILMDKKNVVMIFPELNLD